MWEHVKIFTFRPLITKNIAPLLVFLSLLILLSGCGGDVKEEIVSVASCKDASGSSVSLSWDAPTKNIDGSDLVDLAGYKIYYGTTSGNYPQNIDVGNVLSFQVTGLSNGTTYYFVGTAYNISGVESYYSNLVCATVN